MNKEIKEKFLILWERYFNKAELPICFYYSDDHKDSEQINNNIGWNCLISELAKVRTGKSVAYNSDGIACNGAKRYLGFSDKISSDFKYFLSYGNKCVEGERYKRTPDLVKEFMKNQQDLSIPGKNIIFKRWDKLTEYDKPEVIVFFATADVLSGLFTLANYDQSDPNHVIAPFAAGCGSIVHYPYWESKSENPRSVLGMFDVSARPCVPGNILTFAVPMKKFEKMISFMEESFLITDSWKKVKKRIKSSNN